MIDPVNPWFTIGVVMVAAAVVIWAIPVLSGMFTKLRINRTTRKMHELTSRLDGLMDLLEAALIAQAEAEAEDDAYDFYQLKGEF